MTSHAAGVSFVIPVLNGRRTLPLVIAAVLAERHDRPFEIIVVDDGSSDGSLSVPGDIATGGVLEVLRGPGLGTAAAINAGIRHASYPIICQLDQDVVVHPGWLGSLLAALEDPAIAAAQGHYVAAAGAGLWARTMGLDLEQRYRRMRGPHVDHVCTGNTAYRASALHDVGLLDERLGYGYDNDLSYRLAARGHRLMYCPEAVSTHYWREAFGDYLRQQFGVGYGRLDLVWRHPSRARGDNVSGVTMMLHAPVMLLAWMLLGASLVSSVLGGGWRVPAEAAIALVGLLAAERTVAGFAAWHRTKDAAGLVFPIAHLARDCAWALAILLWTARRVLHRDLIPSHSMPRPQKGVSRAAGLSARRGVAPGSMLVVVPAFNEAPNLPRVVADIRRAIPAADLLIVNDGSTDNTEDVLPGLGVLWLTMSQRVGVGGAVRTGMRYAARRGYQCVARVDGDGQHRACDLGRLLAPVLSGRVDAAIGSRFLTRRSRLGLRRISQSALAALLTLLTRRRVTDPTSGFWLFGPRALALLGRHHPGGYAEPELVLLLSRNGLRTIEVPIRMRPRLSGRTSITTARGAIALARTMLALVVVPFRGTVEGEAGD
jgi:glycosyltransferase involved in cell wall biosynthesis